ncbi:hypothetical protein [Streptococcus ovuberis]|uniref:hypothetical protein n=1 Tax=Streptococcus ovuberis TaxID=1936207 RepID=UPI001FE816FA|nr:hypothetical protein [Streptococcus ovuberis]
MRLKTISNLADLMVTSILRWVVVKIIGRNTDQFCSVPQVKKWQNSLFQEGLSNNYIRTVHQILQQVLDLAVKLGMLPTNVAKTVGNVKKDRPKVDF